MIIVYKILNPTQNVLGINWPDLPRRVLLVIKQDTIMGQDKSICFERMNPFIIARRSQEMTEDDVALWDNRMPVIKLSRIAEDDLSLRRDDQASESSVPPLSIDSSQVLYIFVAEIRIIT